MVCVDFLLILSVPSTLFEIEVLLGVKGYKLFIIKLFEKSMAPQSIIYSDNDS